MSTETTHNAWQDIRLRGFADLALLAEAWHWLDATPAPLVHETIGISDAAGRILAETVTAGSDLPSADTATTDGYAVNATETEGASAYNPLVFSLSSTGSTPCACPVVAGSALPAGYDAILDFGAISQVGQNRMEILAPASPGDGVAPRASTIRAGATALAAGRRLRPQDIALLGVLGIAELRVIRRPRVALTVAGPKTGTADALTPMLRALIVRDGGQPVQANSAADVILIAGRSGAGGDDIAALDLIAAGGTMTLHGIAIRPGISSGCGTLGLGPGPVILLPGDPPACLAAYDLLAGRLIRRLAGLPAELPYRAVSLPLGRKIVSMIGLADIVPVIIANGTATPAGAAGACPLTAFTRADGFVMVPETLEGHAAGDTVRIYLYDPA
ncbi:MAG TPA: molybdopterin biosynthesis protein [Acidiphilium sp.]